MGHAAQAVKFNRAQLKKKRRTFKELKASYVGYATQGDLNFKTLTPFEQQKIRDKIRAEAKRDRFNQLKMGVLSFAILVLLGFGLYFLVTGLFQ